MHMLELGILYHIDFMLEKSVQNDALFAILGRALALKWIHLTHE
jgi:hypothetical protein